MKKEMTPGITMKEIWFKLKYLLFFTGNMFIIIWGWSTGYDLFDPSKHEWGYVPVVSHSHITFPSFFVIIGLILIIISLWLMYIDYDEEEKKVDK